MAKDLSYFLGLRYRIELEEDEDGGFVAHHPELRGCIAQGETADEAVQNLRDARAAWIQVRLEDGLSVPEPREQSSCSGRLLLRMPRSLHEELADAAERDGVSLNQFVVAALSRHVWNDVEAQRTESWIGHWNRKASWSAFATYHYTCLNPTVVEVARPFQAPEPDWSNLLLVAAPEKSKQKVSA